MDIGETIIAALEFKGELLVVYSKKVHQGGIQVMDVHGIPGHIVAIVISRAMDMAAPDPRTGQHLCKTTRMMVTAGSVAGFLRVGGPPELPTPHHESILEEAPLLKILDQPRHWLLGIPTLARESLFQLIMLVPSHVEELDEANVPLSQTAGYQAIPRKTPLFSYVGPIELQHVFRLLRDVR